MTEGVTRRSAVHQSLAFLGVYALLGETAAHGRGVSRSVRSWLAQQRDLAKGLADASITQREWSAKIEQLASEVDVAQLMAEARRGEVKLVGTAGANQPVRRQLHFIGADGRPEIQNYEVMLLHFNQGDILPPHMHENSGALHLVTEGEMRVRTFNLVGRADKAAIVTPSVDRRLGVGASKSMTTGVDNIHWFTATTPYATAFNLSFEEHGPGGGARVQQPVDIRDGTRLADGSIQAPFLSWGEATQKYVGL